jgi:hypothetical protein
VDEKSSKLDFMKEWRPPEIPESLQPEPRGGNAMEQLLQFLYQLEARQIHFILECHRDAVIGERPPAG